jgi:hypothetical protein
MRFICSEENNKPNTPEVLFDVNKLVGIGMKSSVSPNALAILLLPVYHFEGSSLSKDNHLINLKRKFYVQVVIDEVVKKVFKNKNDARRDLIGRNVPQHITTSSQAQNMFYFIRVCVCAVLVDKMAELENDNEFAKVCKALSEWTEEGEERLVHTNSRITVDGERTIVYDRRGMFTCYDHKFIDKLYAATVKGRR